MCRSITANIRDGLGIIFIGYPAGRSELDFLLMSDRIPDMKRPNIPTNNIDKMDD